jgi:hypothetical protein
MTAPGQGQTGYIAKKKYAAEKQALAGCRFGFARKQQSGLLRPSSRPAA